MLRKARPLSQQAIIGIMSQFTQQTSLIPCSKFLYSHPPIFLYSEINNFNGGAFRMLFSPKSKILSIHYFSTNPFQITDSKKFQNEINNYCEQQVIQRVDDLYTTTSSSEMGMKAPSNLFLMRDRQSQRDLRDFEILNDMVFHVQPQVFRLNHESEREDIFVYKRKSRLNVEKEWLYNFMRRTETDKIKRRRLEESHKMNDY